MPTETQIKKDKYKMHSLYKILLILAIGVIGFLIATGDFTSLQDADSLIKNGKESTDFDTSVVVPTEGVELPVVWGDLGKQMVEAGVIDTEKFERIYEQRGGLSEEARELLYGSNNGNLVINSDNAGFLLNLLWGLGLGNKNPVLEEGPMQDEQYGGPQYFASTGGWTLASGDVMDHYSKHTMVSLTLEQQKLVEEVSKNVYRPCCGNSTYFPDCNHGIAMLALLELLASQGATEGEMYEVALDVNSYWFPDTYFTIAMYFAQQGIEWKDIDPKTVLGFDYSSAIGYQDILSKVQPTNLRGGASCGV